MLQRHLYTHKEWGKVEQKEMFDIMIEISKTSLKYWEETYSIK